MSSVSRRDFINILKQLLGATGLTALFGPLVAYFYPPTLEETPSQPVKVGPVSDLPKGEAVKVNYGRFPAIVIHTPKGFRAYSAVCTHFACIVSWDPDLEQIVCPCHDGFFEPLEGKVLSGPPPAPLDALPLEIIEDEIFIGGSV
jgi:Rieske Fe-S protein